MRIKEIVSALEQFAPLPLQDGFDNAGMQIGLTEVEEVAGALLCLDVTETVIDEAIALGFNLIISHHPLLFFPLKSITGKDYVERCVQKAIRNNIAIYAAHTNLDNVQGGVNYKMAEKLGLTRVVLLDPHPSEMSGAGVIGELEEPQGELEFLNNLKRTFEVECLEHSKLTGRLIQRVALCGGAGSFLINKAVLQEADVFITGEIKYHEFMGREKELLLASIGHYESEQYTLELFKEILSKQLPNLKIKYTEINTNPIKYL